MRNYLLAEVFTNEMGHPVYDMQHITPTPTRPVLFSSFMVCSVLSKQKQVDATRIRIMQFWGRIKGPTE